ncbi:MAG: hypothetical protein GX458_23115, partial [Phyllobacteriaceae bacterium]|nr:hypothetical protein [Phyllobacteriaceae bacterium]
GAIAPFELPPGWDPVSATFLDPEGPALRIVDLNRLGGPPRPEPVAAAKPFTVAAKWIGQVFGVAVDDAAAPNVFVAASSAYGLALVAPRPDGGSARVRTGGAGVAFMPGQWGPGGGPGTIWKIDGVSGAVSRFAEISTGGRPNSGAALGGLAFDPVSKSLFVADRETGLVHRLDARGVDLGTWDHGLAGTVAVGLDPVAAAPGPGIDLANPGFDTARPTTWGLAAPERRVFGLAVQARRLYYAVADGARVWSVGLGADGGFGTDPRIEVVVPPAAGPTEIAKIAFDDEGRMYLAERPAPTGAQDFEALTVSAIGRLLRYAPIGVEARGATIWQTSPDEFAVGLAEVFRNDVGGVAIGYSHDADGRLDPNRCGGFVWTTGERLLVATDPALAARLGVTTAPAFGGLQGTALWRIRRGDEPPTAAYFIDWADAPSDPAARGHVGDVAIPRPCAGEAAALTPEMFLPGGRGLSPLVVVPPTDRPPDERTCRTRVCGPPGRAPCAIGEVWSRARDACVASCGDGEHLVGGRCCTPAELRRDGACDGTPSTDIGQPGCGVGETAIGPAKTCCPNDRVHATAGGETACCAEPLQNGACGSDGGKIPEPLCPTCCAAGWVSTGATCCPQARATATGVCCPTGEVVSADRQRCEGFVHIPKLTSCCAAGFVPTRSATCCSITHLTTAGACCAGPVDPKDRSKCAISKPARLEGETPAGKACPRGERRDDEGRCRPIDETVRPSLPGLVPILPRGPRVCGPGERRDARGVCVPRRPGSVHKPPAIRSPVVRPPVVRPPIVCPPGTVRGPRGRVCVPIVRGRIERPAAPFRPLRPFRPQPR